MITRAVIRRNGISARLNDEKLEALLESADAYSAAELEAITLLAYDDVMGEDVSDDSPTLTIKYLERALADFMPTRETKMIEYMEWLAVSEASNRRLLPERFRSITVETLQGSLGEARRALASNRLH